MNILEKIKNGFTFFDGGTGTVLQKKGLQAGELPEEWNLTHREDITELHLAYINAGCHIINTNTFGANILKFSREHLEEIISAAVENALEAKKRSGREDVWIALDIGPSGKLLKPYGNLDFEDAVAVFAETVKRYGSICSARSLKAQVGPCQSSNIFIFSPSLAIGAGLSLSKLPVYAPFTQ